MASVVYSMKTKKSIDPSAASVVEENDWLNFISQQLRIKMLKGIKIKDMAAKTGLSGVTISNLVYGITSRPHMKTVSLLMKYLGYKLVAKPA